ncbi:MAG: hypothetical protein LC770_00855 [Acidobacteria bacterium]|nr:hypothetical protein [Acidobacteriota bacterium]
MSANVSEQNAADQNATAAPVPKRITNAQTVCNEKNARGKLCNGHLKQLRTAGEAAEVHLRGDDVLSKCQTCRTLYMGPPLGHVRDPQKQSRFVEAELTALLQAAGGTMPVIKKDERGVFVMVESASGHAPAAAKPAAQKTATAGPPPTAPASAAPPKPAAAPKPTAPKAGAEPDRKLFRRSNYMGVADTGPVPGETFEQKVARLKAVSVAAKRRAEEGGGEVAPSAETSAASTAPEVPARAPAPVATAEPSESAPSVATAPAPASNIAPKPTGNADRTLMTRSTYCGVADTGPVAGESFEQKVERLRAVSAAAKQRSEQGEG